MHRKSLFYKIYFSILSIFLAFLIIGLIFFHGWLKNYEKVQPESIIESLVSDHLKKNDIYSVRDKYSLKISKYESESNFNNTLKTIINNRDLSFSTSATKPVGCDYSYTVKAGKDNLLNVFLKSNKNKKGYYISGIEFEPNLYKSFSLFTPSNIDIRINNITVSKKDRTNKKLPELKSENLKSANIINKQVINLNYMLNEPSNVKATLNGKDIKVLKDKNIYTVSETFNEKDTIGDIATKASTACAAYMQNDCSFYNVSKYLDNTSDFYNRIRKSLVGFVLPHDGYTINNMKASEYHKYSDNLFSCRIQFTNVLKKGSEKYYDPFDKYVFLKSSGSTYKVIEMQNAEVNQDE